MDGRMRVAAGGFVAAAAAVVVIGAVITSNGAALADTPGASAGIPLVRIAEASQSASPDAAAELPASTTAPVVSPTPVTVPAPEPKDVSAAAPVVAQASTATEDELAADASASGSWDQAREWAVSHGWSQEKIDTWIAKLQSKVAEWRAADDDASSQKTTARAEKTSGRVDSPPGSKKDRSTESPVGD